MELLLLHSSLILLLLSSHGLRSTEGRELHYQLKEHEPPKVQTGTGTAMSAALIGSRPPRCEGKCAPCGRCEAVQVPVAPQDMAGAGRSRLFRASGDGDGGGIDESSTNYKPLNWKCRCADRRIRSPWP